MSYTNLNIKTTGKTFKYIVEYYDDPDIKACKPTYFSNKFGYFFYDDDEINVLHEKNYWNEIDKNKTYEDYSIPSSFNRSSFKLYFPRYSIETYENGVMYVLTINTWINGVCIFLDSCLIDRKNAVASEIGPRKFLNDEYYEYIKVDTIDPFYLIYGDEWKIFRQRFCKELIYGENIQKNNSASNINITLTPVKKIGDTWVKLDGYDSSQSSILLSPKKDNMMNTFIQFDNESGTPKFNCEVRFNHVYENNFDEYLKETYQIDITKGYKIKYNFTIRDQEDLFKFAIREFDTAQRTTEFNFDEFKFDSWQDYFDGMFAQVYVVISKDENDILVMNSNKIFIDQEIFKYLLEQPIRKIDLNSKDMELKKYDVVNIIKNEVISVERPADYKANIVKPVFVKVQEADSISLHRSVIENIVINLDKYKNKVDAFILKVGDANYYEIGRINTGVVFKIVGTSLPENDGLYYVLNSDGELVTTGKYTIV